MARQPFIFAICPAIIPVAPAAAEITTVSPGLWLPHIEQAEVGSHARHAKPSKVDGQRCHFWIDLVKTFPIADRVFLDAHKPRHIFARSECRILRLDHAAQAARPHHLANTHRRNVRLAFVDPTAHCRIERNVKNFHQQLAIAHLSHRLFHIFPVATFWQAHRASSKLEFVIESHQLFLRNLERIPPPAPAHTAAANFLIVAHR